MKAFSNKLSYIPSNRAIEIFFYAKNPFIALYILPWARGNERLSVISDESIILVLHGLNLILILESSGDNAGFRIGGNKVVRPYLRFGFMMALLDRVCMACGLVGEGG